MLKKKEQKLLVPLNCIFYLIQIETILNDPMQSMVTIVTYVTALFEGLIMSLMNFVKSIIALICHCFVCHQRTS